MKQFNKAIVLLVLLLCISNLYAQRSINGVVLSGSDGQPLIGANVVEENTTNGTVTDIDGKYSLTISDSAKNLLISYIGFQKKVVPIGAQATINVMLETDNTTFDEVVVTALAIQREKRSLGYGTTTVKDDDLNRVSPATPLSLM